MRARLTDGWSPWLRLRPDDAHGPDAGEDDRRASAPIWFGGATGYELSLAPGARSVEVHLVRPTTVRANVVLPGAEPAGAEGTEAAYRVPSIRPRSAWGARPYRGTVDTAPRLQRVVVHHTVNGNGYGAASVPAMLRSIQAFHQGSRGWDDIGYNFVIDRFGTVWEARARSLYEAVIGAHARDANDGSVGIAYLGDGTATRLSTGATANLGKVIGWKLRLHSSRPSGSTIKGHRDVGQTACPGNALYAHLGAVRNRAVALQPPDGPFFDVTDQDTEAGYLLWGREAGVILALPDGRFLPRASASRGDAIFWLWRLAGRPTSPGPHGFTDVAGNAHYRQAVQWARADGILAELTGETQFRPGQATRRDVFVRWLWRYVKSPDPSVAHGYTDVTAGQALYDWAAAYKLVPGATFAPATQIPRHEAVRLLYRLRPFDDVPRGHPMHAGVMWARHHVITGVPPDNRFEPAAGLQRRDAVSWLWRMLDRPADPVPPDHPFTDVGPAVDYDAALDWAAQAGWVEGTSPTSFAPTAVVTRGDAVTWLWRAAGRQDVDNDHSFTDAPTDGSDLDLAVDWVRQWSLLGGTSATTFAPGDPLRRGEFARLMFQLAKTADAWAITPPTTTI